ncbi:Alanine racemase [Poriferisphaera corsica]|uniref:Alanine racemase n=1 Tax=Poriferisphaera corsica TaxID=2528020 RepID=A0A517YRI1_9BACT|nr:alanine racemase [Poriferisphaera corsica]QDU32827.1 Alanine racemase [Poriferisphaera corsica]
MIPSNSSTAENNVKADRQKNRRSLDQAPNSIAVSWVEVDLNALDHNVNSLRNLTSRSGQPAKVCGVVKKNAYGMGADVISHRLIKLGCEMLAVYSPQEADELIKSGINKPVLLFLPFTKLERDDSLYRPLSQDRLHLSVHDFVQLDAINAIGRTYGLTIPIHIMLDTGMSRGGMSLSMFDEMIGKLADYKHVKLAGIYSHMATADDNPEFLDQQWANFEGAIEKNAENIPKDVTLHIGNTCAILRDGKYHFDMIRPGIGLWGYGYEFLEPGPIISDSMGLKHAVSWLSSIALIQRMPKGSKVGYGGTATLERDSLLAVVPIGYGDGYPLALSSKGMIRLHPTDERLPICDVPVLGRVNMDQISIDLTDVVQDWDGEIESLIGSVVELYSADENAPNSVPRTSAMIGSHPWEILCRIAENVPRVYLK